MQLTRWNPDTQQVETIEIHVSDQVEMIYEFTYDEEQPPLLEFGWDDKEIDIWEDRNDRP